ncbi:uncharacterized protein LOC112087621 [Eutrema salsugineum]|uniref:uncharacterized protein LOC112087621 n=1 Tax=Eutrema salsugineum TaxID=72664 RepID=UPI000CED6C17|nr:uncharacterized protein LOC112087621 [Eutrema salsugineum]
MAKNGRKLRNRSLTPEDDGSAVNAHRDSDMVEEPEVMMTKSQHIVRSGKSGGIEPMPKLGESFDSIHSPFYLHSSDHPGLAIVAHNLDGTNYNSWSIAMRISLDAKNKLSFVDGSLPRPSENDNCFKIWSRCNSLVKSWILNVVSKEIYDSILYYPDAMEMWDDLFVRFKVNNLPRKYQLEQAVMTLKQGSLDLSAYYTKKKTLWEQLSNTRNRIVKKCDCDQVKELLEEAETSRVIQFLMGLNDNFNNIRGQILNMKPRPSLTEIYNMLDQDESQRVVGFTEKSIPNHSAFQTQATIPEESNILMAQGNIQKPKCSHCSRLGHTVDKCYKLHGFPPGHPKNKKNSSVGSTNLATSNQVQNHVEMAFDEGKENMSNDQLQQMISYLSTKLQSASITSCPDKAVASTSNSVPNISQISGSYSGVDDWSR